MKAIILKQAGGVENLAFTDVAKPDIKSDEVLVEVKAIGLNPADVKPKYSQQMLDMMYAGVDPIILGWDIAGIVSEVGENVSKFKVDDKVFGMVNVPGVGSAYAEFVASPEAHLAIMPDNLSFSEAAATDLAALTALQLLQGKIKQGDRILIHGGSGGVGHFAIQIAKAMGAYVYATASSKNHNFVLSLGADEHIDYTTQDFSQVVSDVDVVFDVFGGEIMEKSLDILKVGGIFLSTVLPGAVKDPDGNELQPPTPQVVSDKIAEKNIQASPFLVVSNGEDIQAIANMLKDGTLSVHIHQTFPFEQMREAQTCVENGGLVGKVVVTLD